MSALRKFSVKREVWRRDIKEAKLLFAVYIWQIGESGINVSIPLDNVAVKMKSGAQAGRGRRRRRRRSASAERSFD